MQSLEGLHKKAEDHEKKVQKKLEDAKKQQEADNKKVEAITDELNEAKKCTQQALDKLKEFSPPAMHSEAMDEDDEEAQPTQLQVESYIRRRLGQEHLESVRAAFEQKRKEEVQEQQDKAAQQPKPPDEHERLPSEEDDPQHRRASGSRRRNRSRTPHNTERELALYHKRHTEWQSQKPDEDIEGDDFKMAFRNWMASMPKPPDPADQQHQV